MGLRIPADLAAWHDWQQRRRRLRRLAALARRRVNESPTYLVGRRSSRLAAILVAFESHSASSLSSLGRPLEFLDASACVVVPESFDRMQLPGEWVWGAWDGRLDSIVATGGTVLSGGHYLPLGASLYEQAKTEGVRFVTVQHGLMTPWAPPLAPDSHLLAWSDADASFWRSGRRDVSASVVGSQLFWEAAQAPAEQVSRFERPVFLGQLHGAELPRAGMVRAATSFWKKTGASYRPHPGETDLASRAQHALWRRSGMQIDTRGVPLASLGQPVVSAFSTGVIEAAARGLPSWVYYPDAPPWLVDFWGRYGMSRWGGPPTPAPTSAPGEPAEAIASWAKEQQ